MNNRTKAIGATTAIMSTVIALGILAVVKSSSKTSAAQTDHEKDVAAHPVINTKVDALAKSVGDIGDNVETMMMRQAGQIVSIEAIKEDISELKEEHD